MGKVIGGGGDVTLDAEQLLDMLSGNRKAATGQQKRADALQRKVDRMTLDIVRLRRERDALGDKVLELKADNEMKQLKISQLEDKR